MKTFICIISILLALLFLSASSVWSQTQVVEGYTFISGGTGTRVCLGRWIPSSDVALPGVCEGQVVDVEQLTAVSAKLTAEKLDQLLVALTSIDQKLAVNNDQVKRLIEVTLDTQASIEQQVDELLYEKITTRFDTLPEEILANDLFREELTKLKEDILKEVEKHYTKRTTPSKK
jgi:hypothetical protein